MELAKSIQKVCSNSDKVSFEIIALQKALQRIAWSDITAPSPNLYLMSQRCDGFVIASSADSGQSANQYKIIDDPAGKPYPETLQSSTDCKCVTGGCVPKGGLHFVPSDDCIEQNGNAGAFTASSQYKTK